MSTAPRVLLTGPARGVDAYARAAERAGWAPLVRPLLRIEERELDASRLERPDWVCITSSNALPALERLLAARPGWRTVPAAVVGGRTAVRLAALGLDVARGPAPTAAELARELARELAPGARVLWLRGDRAHELGEALRAAGAKVDDPVVYASLHEPPGGPPPAADAVFFASPSAVAAWLALPGGRAAGLRAIAVGPTTRDALQSAPKGAFADVRTLDEPGPEALGRCLAELVPRRDERTREGRER